VELRVTQRTEQAEQLFAAFRGDHDLLDVDGGDTFVPSPPFLTGKRLLSTQSFRELFRTETLNPDDSLEIRALAMLFTDLKASTQLYERVGDLKALALVRQHFKLLRDVVAKHEGAVVKTIGDAVMATFSSPVHAAAAAVEMHQVIEDVPELQIKVGVHVGPCVAVDSNERLDYFGQTVNIAARVQALAEGREVVVTDSMLQSPGVADVLARARLPLAREEAQLKGIDAPVVVHRATVA
jgi:class 3 adenylate cyclase